MQNRPDGSGQKHKATSYNPWRPDEIEALRRLRGDGATLTECARQLGRKFSSVENKAGRLGLLDGAPRGLAPIANGNNEPAIVPLLGQTGSWSESGDSASLVRVAHEPVRTLADLISVCEIDTQIWTVIEWTANTWETSARGSDGQFITKTNYQVKARLKRNAIEDSAAGWNAMLDGCIAARKAPAVARKVKTPASDIAQFLIIADPHFGKLCWSRGTGGADYDTAIAYDILTRGATDLMQRGGSISKRYIVSLGDYLHFDTLAGTTTSGTFVDRDSRVPKMLEVGTEALARIAYQSAESAETELILVPGNHDEILSAALQRIMVSEFRRNPNVAVDDTHTRRKSRLYGANLIGINHGDKRKKELCSALAIENPRDWGQSRYREYHVGHLHTEGERYEGTITHAGVTLRTHRSLAPPDSWHADMGFIGSPRGMSAWMYHAAGGLTGMLMHDPDIKG